MNTDQQPNFDSFRAIFAAEQKVPTTTVGTTVPLAETVAALDSRAQALEHLCGEVLATIGVNFDRGYITTVNPPQFAELLLKWAKRFNQLSPHNL